MLHKATQLWFWGWQSFHLLKSFEEFINSQRTLMAQTWHLTHPGTKCSHATCNRPKTTSVSGALMKSISRSFATVTSWWQDPLATCLGESSWYHQHHHQQHHHVGAKAGTRTLVHQNKIKNRAKYLEKIFPWNHQTLFKHWACQDMGPWQLGCWHTAWTSFSHEFQMRETFQENHQKWACRSGSWIVLIIHEPISTVCFFIGVPAAPNRSPIRSWFFLHGK